MARSTNPLFFFFFLFFSVFPLLLHCRTALFLSFKTSPLNVTACIKKIHQLRLRLRFSSSPSLSAQIYSRTFLREAPQSNDYTYRSLTLARLERDSARVKSLLARLDRGLKRKLGVLDEKLQVPVILRTSQGYGEYLTRVGFGNPPSFAFMVLDTASDVTWIQCSPCTYCYPQADPIFKSDSSASYLPLSCQSPQCNALDPSDDHCLNNKTCLYEVSYGDGSYSVGNLVTETITIGSTPVNNISLGCGHNNEGLFHGAAGVLGLGGGSLSLPTQLNAPSFSYCLVDYDSNSSSTLEFNSPLPLNAVTAPLRRNYGLDAFYYVELIGVSVGGELLPIPESSFELDGDGMGGTIVDSSTMMTWLRREAYDMLREAFLRYTTYGLPSAKGVGLFDACYDLSSVDSVEVPTVSFHFPEGQELMLSATNYLMPIDSEGTFSLAFAPSPSTLSIIGNVQQQGTRVSFDLSNRIVGFSPNSC